MLLAKIQIKEICTANRVAAAAAAAQRSIQAKEQKNNSITNTNKSRESERK